MSNNPTVAVLNTSQDHLYGVSPPLALPPSHIPSLSFLSSLGISAVLFISFFVCPADLFTWPLCGNVRVQRLWQTEPQEMARIQCFGQGRASRGDPCSHERKQFTLTIKTVASVNRPPLKKCSDLLWNILIPQLFLICMK